MIKTLLATLALTLCGCATASELHDPEKIVNPDMILRVMVVDDLYMGDIKINGYAKYEGDTCYVVLDTTAYTHSCIGHEIRHCLEGPWHGNEPTTC